MRFGNVFGAAELDSIPGCSQLAISHGVFIAPEHRGHGLGNANHQLRLNRAKELHYDCLIATVVSTNDKEKKNLKDNGWSYIHSFYNSRTENIVEIWTININKRK